MIWIGRDDIGNRNRAPTDCRMMGIVSRSPVAITPAS